MDKINRKKLFLNNPKNAKFFNKGNSNINIDGNNNQVAEIINNYSNTTVKNQSKITPDYSIHISNIQASEIQSMIKSIVDKEVIKGMNKSKAFAKWHAQLKRYMKVTSYLLIEKEDYEKAIKYLLKNNVLKRKGTRRKNNNYWRNDIYKSIYTRAAILGISKDEVKNIANKRYGTNITSLKELGEQNLDKLRIYIYSLKGD